MKTIIKTYLAVVAVSLVCHALSPMAEAVVPPPDGGYPGSNTAEGENALLSHDHRRRFNTAIGFNALFSDDMGTSTTASWIRTGPGGWNAPCRHRRMKIPPLALVRSR